MQMFVTVSFSQRKIDDSLKNVVAHSSNDTAVIDAYQQLCMSYQESIPTKGIEYALLGLQKAKQANNKVRIGNLLQSLGVAYDYKNNLDSCFYYLNKSIAIFEELKRIDKASHVYADVAFAYFARGNYELTLRNHLKSLELRKQFGNEKYIAISYGSIGLVYRVKKDYKKALEYYRLSLSYQIKNGNVEQQTSNYINIASAYQNNKQYDSAYYFSKIGLQLAKKNNFEEDVISNKLNIATALIGLNKNTEALKLLQEVEQSKVLNNMQSNVIGFYFDYCELYLKKNQPAKAITYATKGLIFTQTINRKEPMMAFYEKLSKANYNLGNYKLAFQFADSSKAIADSLLNEENLRQVNEMSAVYETVEKTKQIDNLTLENSLSLADAKSRKRERNYFVLASILFLGLTAVAYKAYVSNRKKKEKLNEQNLIIEKSLQEKEVLLREIHHRVKNNLQIVSSLLSLQSNYIKDETALSAVLDGKNRVESMGLIHQNLYQEANLAVVDIQSYIANLCDNLFASYNIVSDKIILKKEIETVNLDVDTVIPIGLILNELITNCLKYAFVNNGEGTITISLKEENNVLKLSVYDNGVGLPENFDVKNKKSFGYRMIYAFLQKLKGTINIYTENGTKVDVLINNYKLAKL
jgi:hypothetical protein